MAGLSVFYTVVTLYSFVEQDMTVYCRRSLVEIEERFSSKMRKAEVEKKSMTGGVIDVNS